MLLAGKRRALEAEVNLMRLHATRQPALFEQTALGAATAADPFAYIRKQLLKRGVLFKHRLQGGEPLRIGCEVRSQARFQTPGMRRNGPVAIRQTSATIQAARADQMQQRRIHTGPPPVTGEKTADRKQPRNSPVKPRPIPWLGASVAATAARWLVFPPKPRPCHVLFAPPRQAPCW